MRSLRSVNRRRAKTGLESLTVVIPCVIFAAIFLAVRQHQSRFAKPHRNDPQAATEKPSLLQRISSFQQEELSLREELHQTVRILCWVAHDWSKEHNRNVIMQTWGSRCNRLLFVTGSSGGSEVRQLGPNAFHFPLARLTNDSYQWLWAKTSLAFQEIERQFGHMGFDYVYKTDDDSFAVIENMRLFLLKHKLRRRHSARDEAAYFGLPYNYHNGYNSGGPGYLLSWKTLEKLAVALRNNVSCAELSSDRPEDVHLGECLRAVGVQPADTRDAFGRFRFSPFDPLMTMHESSRGKRYAWFEEISAHPLQPGWECCSDSMAAFHYVTPDHAMLYHYFIHHLHPFSQRVESGW